MKKTGLEIVEMIAKGEAPKKILAIDFAEEYEWDEKNIDYYDRDNIRLVILNNLDTDFEIIEEEKVWRPKDDEGYYYIQNAEEVEFEYYTAEYDELMYEIGNCFKTSEEAQKVLEKIKIYVRLKRHALEHNTKKIDWNNQDQEKFYISYDCDINDFVIFEATPIKDMKQVYFTNEGLCWKAIKEIGEDNIKKLFEE